MAKRRRHTNDVVGHIGAALTAMSQSQDPMPEAPKLPTESHWFVACTSPHGDFRCSKCGAHFSNPHEPAYDTGCDERLVRAANNRVVEGDALTFERAIEANPADAIARLVYGDWLDEHNDPKYARGVRVVPDWFISNEVKDNYITNFLPTDLRQRCMMWIILEDMFPSYTEKDFRLLFQTTQSLQEMLLKVIALAEQE